MTLQQFLRAWDSFWFKPIKPTSIAVYRIGFGLLVLEMCLIHIGDNFLAWYGKHSVVTFESVKNYFWWNEPRFDLLLSMPQTDQAYQAYFITFVVAAVFMTLGLASRLSMVYVCLGLISLHHHNPFNINGGDVMMRLGSIFLCFSNAGDALSLDNVIRRKLKWQMPPTTSNPWAQRMIQIQLCVVYVSTFCCKIVGAQWLDGTAVYYATRLDDMMRFSSFMFNQMWFCKLLCWYTLAIEIGMPLLVWFKELRYPMLLGILFLHLGIEYAINLPIFEWAFIITLATFVEPDDWGKAYNYFAQQKYKDCPIARKLNLFKSKSNLKSAT